MARRPKANTRPQLQLDVDVIEQMSAGQLIHHYLLSSFCYYHLNESPLTDFAFDLLCKRLLVEIDSIEHQHKKFVDKESLEAGTCLLGWHEFPMIVSTSAWHYLGAIADGSLQRRLQDGFDAERKKKNNDSD